MSQHETIDAYLARGGQIDYLPRGAMTETGWSPEKRITAVTNTQTASNIEKREAEAAARERDRKAKAERPKAPKPPRAPTPRRFGRPRPNLALELAFDKLEDGDTVTTLAERIGKQNMATWQLLKRLRDKGRVESRGRERGHTTWHKVPSACP
jgi:hypothetical protein